MNTMTQVSLEAQGYLVMRRRTPDWRVVVLTIHGPGAMLVMSTF